MKKNFKYAILSAIALTGAVSLTSCSSSEDVDANPTYDGESVKTQFTISFPQNVARSTTRQTSAIVQNEQTITSFRGIDQIKLIPFGINGKILSSTSRIGAPIKLAKQIKASTTTEKTVNNNIAAQDLMDNNNSVLYQDVNIPVGTGSFLFYGKALDNEANDDITSIADKFKFGTLTPSADALASDNTTPANITFTPVKIQGTVSSAGTGTAAKIVAYLNSIATALSAWSASDNVALKALYDSFIEQEAGSSQAVADVIGDLLWALRSNTTTAATDVCSAILDGGSLNTSTGVATVGTEHNYIASAVKDATNGTYTITLGSACNGYPANNNLPEGAAIIDWNNGAFEVISTDVPTATSGDMSVAALDRYVYPANLQYYVNSKAVVSKESQAEQYKSDNSWLDIIGHYSDGYVGVSTRSVAIKDPIQYGVGLLKMQAKTDAATLADNSDQLDNVVTTAVTVAEGGFPIKGILIGGQRAVDWEFLPKSTSGLYTIYDDVANTSAIKAGKASFGGFNYTLVLETPVQEHVYIALELVNNTGQTFYGQGNQKILPNRTFYLVGELNPTLNSTQVYVRDHDTYWPNGTAAQKSQGDAIDQVFIQDYVSTLLLTIKDLRKALNTIPDLRMPNMEFGLSVDLTWEPGITFEVDL